MKRLAFSVCFFSKNYQPIIYQCLFVYLFYIIGIIKAKYIGAEKTLWHDVKIIKEDVQF